MFMHESKFPWQRRTNNAAKQPKKMGIVVELTIELREMNWVSMEERKEIVERLISLSSWKGDMIYWV
jgi:hypothetical protein